MELKYTLQQINEAAREILTVSAAYKVFAVHGEMGAGKTTFIHAMCESMGVQDPITSPTFSIINQYKSLSGETIYHMDLYRLKDEAEAIGSGVEDCLFSGSTCLVEWPEHAMGIFPGDTLHMKISATGDLERKIVIDQL